MFLSSFILPLLSGSWRPLLQMIDVLTWTDHPCCMDADGFSKRAEWAVPLLWTLYKCCAPLGTTVPLLTLIHSIHCCSGIEAPENCEEAAQSSLSPCHQEMWHRSGSCWSASGYHYIQTSACGEGSLMGGSSSSNGLSHAAVANGFWFSVALLAGLDTSTAWPDTEIRSFHVLGANSQSSHLLHDHMLIVCIYILL